jgi:hypothetical protein
MRTAEGGGTVVASGATLGTGGGSAVGVAAGAIALGAGADVVAAPEPPDG